MAPYNTLYPIVYYRVLHIKWTQEYRDNLCLRYDLPIQNLPVKCEGCGKINSKEHSLNCRLGGLIIGRHNEIRDELSYLTRIAFTGVRDGPLISSTNLQSSIEMQKKANCEEHCDIPDHKGLPYLEMGGDQIITEERGDILVRGFWSGGTDCILDICITDTDAPTYQLNGKDPEQIIADHERSKKENS